MINVLVKLDENTNRVLNVVKAKYMLNDKAEAIGFIVNRYVDLEEPELKPAFVKKIKAIEKQKSIRVNDFAKRYGLKQHV